MRNTSKTYTFECTTLTYNHGNGLTENFTVLGAKSPSQMVADLMSENGDNFPAGFQYVGVKHEALSARVTKEELFNALLDAGLFEDEEEQTEIEIMEDGGEN